MKGSSAWDIENNGHTGKYCEILTVIMRFTGAFTWNHPFASSMS